MSKLYEISSAWDKLMSMDMETDEDQRAFIELLNELQGSFDEKAEAYCKVLRNIESEVDGFDAEIARLKKRKDALENKHTRIRSYFDIACRQIMQEGDYRQVGVFKIRLKKNPPKCIVQDETLIPDEYKKAVVSCEVSKIKDAIKNGIEVPGAYIVQDTSLQIS